jgi:hypothetical protein
MEPPWLTIDKRVGTGLFALGNVFWLDNIAAIAVAFLVLFSSRLSSSDLSGHQCSRLSLLSFWFTSLYVLCLLLLCLL